MAFHRPSYWKPAGVDFLHPTIADRMALRLTDVHRKATNFTTAYREALAEAEKEKEQKRKIK